MITTIMRGDFVHCPELSCFSYDGRVALFDYFEEVESDTGDAIEFDPCLIRSEFTEYESMSDFWKDYDRYEYQCLYHIAEVTTVILVNGGFIIENI